MLVSIGSACEWANMSAGIRRVYVTLLVLIGVRSSYSDGVGKSKISEDNWDGIIYTNFSELLSSTCPTKFHRSKYCLLLKPTLMPVEPKQNCTLLIVSF